MSLELYSETNITIDKNCVLCIEKIDSDDFYIIDCCKVYFHNECYKSFINYNDTNLLKSKCPICKKYIIGANINKNGISTDDNSDNSDNTYTNNNIITHIITVSSDSDIESQANEHLLETTITDNINNNYVNNYNNHIYSDIQIRNYQNSYEKFYFLIRTCLVFIIALICFFYTKDNSNS